MHTGMKTKLPILYSLFIFVWEGGGTRGVKSLRFNLPAATPTTNNRVKIIQYILSRPPRPSETSI